MCSPKLLCLPPVANILHIWTCSLPGWSMCHTWGIHHHALPLSWNDDNLWSMFLTWGIHFHAATVVIEQNTGKSHLVKPEPLPISKMENDFMNDLARLWSFLDRWNYFFKEGQWCWNFAKTSLLEVKLQFLKFICNIRYTKPTKKDWKMILNLI